MIKELYTNYEKSQDEKERIKIVSKFEFHFKDFTNYIFKNFSKSTIGFICELFDKLSIACDK